VRSGWRRSGKLTFTPDMYDKLNSSALVRRFLYYSIIYLRLGLHRHSGTGQTRTSRTASLEIPVAGLGPIKY
jgi:hypothetical protein